MHAAAREVSDFKDLAATWSARPSGYVKYSDSGGPQAAIPI
jgi:hypothetical protein